ncbi:MAG: T9SS type A sorting domain-containing protein [Calditrichaeota bacterium]|nr:T9SS type A sorting domain-containing protein [Calditrichota bacterium]
MNHLTSSKLLTIIASGLGKLVGQRTSEALIMTRILSAFNFLKRVGFAILLLGGLLYAQPYEPFRLYDMVGDTNQRIGDVIFEPLGDQDGDGYTDFLINMDVLNGHLRIMYGGEEPPYRTLDFAYLDVDTSAQTYYWTNYRHNTGKSACADYTGDGIVDIFVDLKQDFYDQCDAYMFIGGGGPEEFDTIWDWRSNYPEASHFVTGLGDFDGNGIPDFTRGGGAFAESFLWYFSWSWPNPPTEPTWMINRDGPGNNGNFADCQGVGDITGDGWPDFMEFVWYPDWSRHYEVWYGGPEADSTEDYALNTDTLEYATCCYGIYGDLNGDGLADLGSYIFDPFAPQTGPAIYYGRTPLNLTEPDVMLEHHSGEQITPDDGQIVGDINEDGYNDLAFRDNQRGSCYLYLGGNPMDSLWSFYLPVAEFDGFRTMLVRGLGDFNGDGIDDWAISGKKSVAGGVLSRVVVFAGDRNWGVPVSEERPDVPHDFVLGTPFPNPFNSEVIVPLTISRVAGKLDVSIYNTLGQLVYSFPDQHLTPGNTHFLRWNGTNQTGEALASGNYFVHGKLGQQVQTARLGYLK